MRNRTKQIVRVRQMLLLQADMAGHSRLARMMAPESIMEIKIALASDLIHQMERAGLGLFVWAGDGGVFCLEIRSPSDVNALIKAGELVFSVLRDINRRYACLLPAGQRLALRVSAHVGQIWTVPERRFWHGEDLNFAMKHERALGEANRFSITEPLRKMLSHACREIFPDRCRVTKKVDGRRMPIWFHRKFGTGIGAGKAPHAARV